MNSSWQKILSTQHSPWLLWFGAVTLIFSFLFPTYAIAQLTLPPEGVKYWWEKGQAASERDAQLESGKDSEGWRLTTREREELERQKARDESDLRFAPEEGRNIYRYAYLEYKLEFYGVLLEETACRPWSVYRTYMSVYSALGEEIQHAFNSNLRNEVRHLLRIFRLSELEELDRELTRGERLERDTKRGIVLITLRRKERLHRELNRSDLTPLERVWFDRLRRQTGELEGSEDAGTSDDSHSSSGGSSSQSFEIHPTDEVTFEVANFGQYQFQGRVTFMDGDQVAILPEGGDAPFGLVSGKRLTSDQFTAESFLSSTDTDCWRIVDLAVPPTAKWGKNLEFSLSVSGDYLAGEDDEFYDLVVGYQHHLVTYAVPIEYDSPTIAGFNLPVVIGGIDIPLDVTQRFTTALQDGINPWEFKWDMTNQFDMTRWEGRELSIGNYLEWAISEDTFGEFTKEAAGSIKFVERDPRTNTAPAPSLDSSLWLVTEADPIPRFSIQKEWK